MSQESNSEKPWGGRFNSPTNEFVERFTASVHFDRRLYRHDIQGSVAHAKMLSSVGILTLEESESIVTALGSIESEIDQGKFEWSVALEDVHMNIERALVDRIGDVGKKLHTARSRNDQVATDIRLFLRDQVDAVLEGLESLMRALVDLAEREAETVMPGYTHLQTAQPVSFGHHMLAWFEMLARDQERFIDARKRINVLPLGSGALAGTTFPIDRHLSAQLLGFDKVSENSLDAVSDRDFAIEFSANASLLMVHFSRMCEELVLWNSQQFSFVEMGDAFCTGSSMMPQKKNPDVPELIRGKSGRVIGHLISLITLMKSQPLAYNKDNQEDKEPLFDTVDTILDCLKALGDLIPSLSVNRQAMRAAALRGFATATDFADYLVRSGIPFRDAHAVVGGAVRLAIDKQCDLEDLSLAEFREFHPEISEDVYASLDIDNSLNARDHFGGTAPSQVRAACLRARERLNK
ncbi:MAG: argininosuccinate lyase [Gammaproteobacteria bacterium]|jgi:argininosuccinate lyase